MKVKALASCPIKKNDGTWTTVIKEFEEEIPDLGRHTIICNKCGEPSYPDCRTWCPMEQHPQQKS